MQSASARAVRVLITRVRVDQYARRVGDKMSRRYWSADWHLNSDSIIRYCNRPFRDHDHMNERIIANANSRVKVGDRGVLVGDVGVAKGAVMPMELIATLEGDWTLLRGNHDPNNKIKTVGTSMIARLSHFNVFVSHIPYFYEEWFPLELRVYVEKHCDFAICGHVHTDWLWWLDSKKPVFNVACDKHKFMPVSDDEVASAYVKLLREQKQGKLAGFVCQPYQESITRSST